MEYLISRFTASSPFKDLLSSTSSPNSKNRITLVVSERLINLPVQIMPPMWKMTIDEVEKAQKEVNAIDGFLWPCHDDTNPGHLSYNE
jgi:protein BCP1